MSFHCWLKYCPPSKLHVKYSLFCNNLTLLVWHLSGAWPAARGVYPSYYGHPKSSQLQWAAGEEVFKRCWLSLYWMLQIVPHIPSECSLPVNSSAIPYSCSWFNWYYSSSPLETCFWINKWKLHSKKWRLQVVLDFQDLIVQGNICVVQKLSLQPCFETRSDLNVQYLSFLSHWYRWRPVHKLKSS